MAWTIDDLERVERAIATGLKEVRFQDRTEVYKDSKDLLTQRDTIQQYLLKTGGGNRIRQHRIICGDGF
jgi:hypothetical protein